MTNPIKKIIAILANHLFLIGTSILIGFIAGNYLHHFFKEKLVAIVMCTIISALCLYLYPAHSKERAELKEYQENYQKLKEADYDERVQTLSENNETLLKENLILKERLQLLNDRLKNK